MSRATIYQDLFSMLSDMTIANGYSRDYTPVKSVFNDSATMSQTPFISLHFGYETPVFDGVGMLESRASLPVQIVTRVKPMHQYRSEIEYAEDLLRSEVIDDIKKRFLLAQNEITDCVTLEALNEIEPSTLGLNDSNKHDMYVAYEFELTYKQPK